MPSAGLQHRAYDELMKQEHISVCNGDVDHQDMYFPSEVNLM